MRAKEKSSVRRDEEMGAGQRLKLQSKFNTLGPNLFLQLNFKWVNAKYISYDNIFMGFLIARLSKKSYANST